MGLFCSKNQKQTANVTPANDDEKNNGDLNGNKETEDNNRTNSPHIANEEQPSPRPENGDDEAVRNLVADDQPPTHFALSNTPAVNSSGDDIASNNIRIAFVGAIESGKSTICQQIKLYCKERPHEIEISHRPAYIYDFLFISMDRLLKLMQSMQISFADSENEKYALIVQSNLGDRRGRPLLSHETDALATLWETPEIQEAYNHRSEINMNDSVKYFFNSIDRIADPDFKPSGEDLIMLYIPTVGVINYVYTVNGRNYSIYDVSGRMLERKKWLGFYDGFDAIIFTLAISEFDQFYENETGKHSRFLHALDLLADTSSDEIFKSTPLFIFLNEVDIFKEKLSRISLKDYLPEYTGSNSEKEALAYMKQLAVNRCSSAQPDKINVYFTTAIDSKKMHKCLNDLFKKIEKL